MYTGPSSQEVTVSWTLSTAVQAPGRCPVPSRIVNGRNSGIVQVVPIFIGIADYGVTVGAADFDGRRRGRGAGAAASATITWGDFRKYVASCVGVFQTVVRGHQWTWSASNIALLFGSFHRPWPSRC